MEPSVFLGYLIKGITSVLCCFEHEQYISNCVDPWCLIVEYPNDCIGFLGGFGKATQYPSMCQNICYGTQCIFWIPGEGYYMFIEYSWP
jgi:hypothetical protein